MRTTPAHAERTLVARQNMLQAAELCGTGQATKIITMESSTALT